MGSRVQGLRVQGVELSRFSCLEYRILRSHVSYGLNSLKGDYIGDYTGDYSRGY